MLSAGQDQGGDNEAFPYLGHFLYFFETEESKFVHIDVSQGPEHIQGDLVVKGVHGGLIFGY